MTMVDDRNPLAFVGGSQQRTPTSTRSTGDPHFQAWSPALQPEDESRPLDCTRAQSSAPSSFLVVATADSPTLYMGKVNAEPAMQDDPSATRTHHAHADVMITASETTFDEYPDLIFKCVSANDTHDELDTPISGEAPERPGRVRFRSRVRITSGLNRRRHASNSEQDTRPLSFHSRSSSLSGSPSSSISAPLRNQAEDEVGKPGWGTLGQRVSILAQGNLQRRKERAQRDQALLAKSVQLGISLPPGSQQYATTERTPLINSSSPYLYVRRNSDDSNASNEVSDDEADRLARDVDLVFGPWPTRLWNHHWWWWKIEPILCCRCLTELDDEG